MPDPNEWVDPEHLAPADERSLVRAVAQIGDRLADLPREGQIRALAALAKLLNIDQEVADRLSL